MKALLATLQLDHEAGAVDDHPPWKNSSSDAKNMADKDLSLLRKQSRERPSRLKLDVFDDDDDDTSTCDADDSQHSAVRHLSREFLPKHWPLFSKREPPKHHSRSSSSRPPVSCIAIEVHTERFEI